ncbi:MAG: hypothetical protein NC114_11695 [Ruminococcus flavefaciens]|nr:hypothetical protein [Ruminococcus flavefaciens]
MEITISWDPEFTDLMHGLKTKYGEELFTLDGIGKQTDINDFSKNFFNNTNSTADVSIDANANVVAKTGIEYNYEMSKPLKRYNSYFLIWKELKKNYGQNTANKIIEAQLTGDIYINDFTDVAMPYSYAGGTRVELKHLDRPDIILTTTMYSLWNDFKILAVEKADWWEVDMSDSDWLIRDGDRFVRLQRLVMHHNTKTMRRITFTGGAHIVVTEDHPVVLADDSIVEAASVIPGMLVTWDDSTNTVANVQTLPIHPIVYDVTTETGYFTAEGHLRSHNCFNYSTYDIFCNGLEGMSSRLKIVPPQSLATFFRQVEQFIVVAANSTLGATGLADLLLVASKYVDKIKETGCDGHVKISNIETYVREQVTSLVYSLNWNYRAVQASFSNVSLYDDTFLDTLCPDYGATKATVKFVQRIYCEVMNTEMRRTPLTFPVTTACFAIDENREIADEGFLQFIAEQNKEYGFINLYNGTTSTLSSCCFGHQQNVTWRKDEHADVQVNNLQQLWSIQVGKQEKYPFLVFRHGDWVRGRCIRLPKRRMYRIVTEHQAVMVASDNHLHVTDTGEKTTIELCPGSMILCSAAPYFPPLPANKTADERNEYWSRVLTIESVSYQHDWIYCIECEDQSQPYFTLANGIVTHNCRLRSEKKSEYFNSFGAGSTKIGSLGVVTANLPRAALKADGDYDQFIQNVHDLFVIAQRINACKRKLIRKRIELNAAPLYQHGYMDLNKQYSTFGVVGINEAVNLMGLNILEETGQRLVIDLLDHISDWIDQAEKAEHAPHNVEQVPAESSAVKLAKKDKMLGYDIGVPLYSNQFIPLITKADMFDRLRLQGMFDAKLSGGAIAHINVGDTIDDTNTLVNLMKYAAKQGVVYWAINYKLNCCPNKHTWVGTDLCPTCGQHWDSQITRVVGFFTTVKNWNPTRRNEDWPNRQFYVEEDLQIKD